MLSNDTTMVSVSYWFKLYIVHSIQIDILITFAPQWTIDKTHIGWHVQQTATFWASSCLDESPWPKRRRLIGNCVQSLSWMTHQEDKQKNVKTPCSARIFPCPLLDVHFCFISKTKRSSHVACDAFFCSSLRVSLIVVLVFVSSWPTVNR